MTSSKKVPVFSGGKRGKYAAAFRSGYGVRVLSGEEVVDEYFVRPSPKFPMVDCKRWGKGHRRLG